MYTRHNVSCAGIERQRVRSLRAAVVRHPSVLLSAVHHGHDAALAALPQHDLPPGDTRPLRIPHMLGGGGQARPSPPPAAGCAAVFSSLGLARQQPIWFRGCRGGCRAGRGTGAGVAVAGRAGLPQDVLSWPVLGPRSLSVFRAPAQRRVALDLELTPSLTPTGGRQQRGYPQVCYPRPAHPHAGILARTPNFHGGLRPRSAPPARPSSTQRK